MFYALNVNNWMMGIFDSRKNNYKEVDLSPHLQPLDTTIWGYLPVDSESILFMLRFAEIYEYNVRTEQFAPLSFQQQIRLDLCSSNITLPFRDFMRFGSSNTLLVCSRSAHAEPGLAYYGLNIVDLSDNSVHQIIELPGLISRIRPWRQVVAGQDGILYVQLSRPIPAIFRDLVSGSGEDSELILWTVPQESSWNVIEIPRADVQKRDIEVLGELAAVDSLSNLYFSRFWYEEGQSFSTLTKVNSQGKITWVLEDAPGILHVSSDSTFLSLGFDKEKDVVPRVQRCIPPDHGTPPMPSSRALRAKIAECVADRGIQTSLNARIDAGQWQSIINEVEALDSTKVTPECAAEIIEMVEYFRTHPLNEGSNATNRSPANARRRSSKWRSISSRTPRGRRSSLPYANSNPS